MIVKRYNISNGRTTDAKIPEDWKVVTKADLADTIINCIHCGQPIRYKDSCVSKRYTDIHGIGYRECVTCSDNYDTLTQSNPYK